MPDAHDPLTLEHVATYPLPGTAVPSSPRFTPDGTHVTYLFAPDRSLTQTLLALNLDDGSTREVVSPARNGETEDSLSLEEKLRRERQRTRALGITRYAWADRGQRLLIPLNGGIYTQDGLDGALQPLVEPTAHPALDPRFSPDAEHVAFVRDAELYVVPTAGGDPTQLTTGARGTGRTHGLADYIAAEEMSRLEGYWWSPDSDAIAFTEVDETHIPVYRILHQGSDEVPPAAQEDHRYPFAGKDNPKVRLGVVPRAGGDVVWMDLGTSDEVYVARVRWNSDGRLLVQLQDRRQRHLRVRSLDPTTGAGHDLWEETSEAWINLHGIFATLETHEPRGGFLWGTERSGFLHLEVRGPDGAHVRTLTEGEWMIDALAGVDEAKGVAYVVGTKDGPTERHLYAVPLAGGEARKITTRPGSHDVVLDGARRTYLDTHSDLDQPPRITLRSLDDDRELRVLHEADDPRLDELGLVPPRIETLRSRDGVELYAAVYDAAGDGPAPLMVNVYGGPHAQRVVRSWLLTVDLRAQYYRRHGVAVARIDNRGSARRGLAFESALRHDMGRVEVEDQVDGVRWLVEQGVADAERVGIYGWSYGGYMSAMALCRAPDVFKLGISGAPVTHWDGYDTHYTERYMGLPQENAEGYEVSSVMHHVAALRGHLLLVHGLIDENVHFRHTARLINALIQHRKPYELLLFPDERHMPRSHAGRLYMEERLWAVVQRELVG